PVSDFGSGQHGECDSNINPLAAAYLVLFPYGIGGIEANREKKIGFNEHIRWALQYYDHRFHIHHSFPFLAFSIEQKREALQSACIQMRQKDFERDAWAIKSVTIDDLKQANKEEAAHVPISNPQVCLLRKHIFTTSGCVKGSDKLRASYQGQIWSMTMKMCGPSLWITINPSDLHDPVVQVFIGEEINMDNFFETAGPDGDHRAQNIARDPYGASKYFFSIIKAVLHALFGIEVTKDCVCTTMGILGRISTYFGVGE
ncbi:hypothetical protein DFH29DRAFT_758462, partial [Suillus ampliporus]